MERLNERLAVAEKAHATLEEALRIKNPSKLERDGAIQRFEYTFEACWKTCQQYLHAVEGRECASPKSCLRGIGEAGILNAEETSAALQMTDDRNRTVHLYQEALAEEIYAHLPAHSRLIGKILHGIRERVSSSCT